MVHIHSLSELLLTGRDILYYLLASNRGKISAFLLWEQIFTERVSVTAAASRFGSSAECSRIQKVVGFGGYINYHIATFLFDKFSKMTVEQ
jgi:hypothetical protein